MFNVDPPIPITPPMRLSMGYSIAVVITMKVMFTKDTERERRQHCVSNYILLTNTCLYVHKERK